MPEFVFHALLVKVNAYLLSTFIFAIVKYLLLFFTYFLLDSFSFIDLLILKLSILCHRCSITFSLVCHSSSTLCSFKYFNLYFIASRIYACLLRKDFLFQNYKTIFCSLFHNVRLICLHLCL